MRRIRPHLLPLAGLALVALGITWPAAIQLGTAVPGHPMSDTYEHLQGYAWVAAELAAGRLPLHTEVLGVPTGGALWFPDTLGALIAAPLTLAFGAMASYSLTVIVQVWFAMVAAYAMGVRLGDSRAAGALAAVVFGASPFVRGLLHSGVSEYLHLAGFPLLWLLSERAMRRGGGAIVAAGAVWAALGWGSVYYALFAAFVPVLAWLRYAEELPWRQAGPRVIGAAAVAAGLLGPVAWLIQGTLAAPDALLAQESAPGWNWVFLPANDLAGFFLPGDQLFPDFRDGGNFGIRHVHYLGWASLAIAGGVWRRWWRPLLLAGVLAAGPSLHWRGQPVRVGGEFVPLPAALLYLPGSPFRAVHHPYRITVLPMLVLAAAAADAMARRPRLALAAAGVVLGETLWVSSGGGALATAAPGPVAALGGDGGVWDLPAGFREHNRRWIGLQAVHGRAVPYTINVFLPAPWRSNALYQDTLHCLARPSAATIARDARPPLRVWLEKDSTQTPAEALGQLRTWGIRFAVLHLDVLKPREATCMEEALVAAGAAPLEEPNAELRVLGW